MVKNRLDKGRSLESIDENIRMAKNARLIERLCNMQQLFTTPLPPAPTSALFDWDE
jgi:hypothetical protein